jgi:hypothetical protein
VIIEDCADSCFRDRSLSGAGDHDVTPDLLRPSLELEPTYMNEAAQEAVEDQPSYANENIRYLFTSIKQQLNLILLLT